MIKVTALTGSLLESSTRFRVRQHIKPLSNFGIQVHEYAPSIDRYVPMPPSTWFPKGINPKYEKPIRYLWQGTKLATRIPGIIGSWTSNITWLLRELLGYRFTLEPLLKNPLVFDVDDAIWLTNSSSYPANSGVGLRTANSIRKIAKRADVVIAGNHYLAEWFSDWTSDVRVIPTAIDTDRFQPKLVQDRKESKRFVIGWTGSAVNLQYLHAMEDTLKCFMNQFADSVLLVMANKPPVFRDLPSERVIYMPWSSELEVEAVQQMDVGLMPLPDNEWAKGKCSFKMLQYMACGIPVVVSPFGMNAEVLALAEVGLGAEAESDWYDALVMLYKNREVGDKYGKNGRIIVEQNFSRKVIVEKLVGVFRELS